MMGAGDVACVVLWIITSLHASPTVVTHECAHRTAVNLYVSPSLIHLVADRRLLIVSSGHVYRPCQGRSPSATLVALLLLAGGIESNPGPSPTTAKTSAGISFGLLNVRSAVHKAALIHDVTADSNLDALVLTETWVTSDAPDAIKLDVAPPGYQVIHQPRGSSSDKRGGGVAIVHRDCITVRPIDVGKPSEFEVLATRLTTQPTVHVTVVSIYKPPGAVTRLFCDQFADLLDQLVTAKQQFVVCGDVNCLGHDGCQLDSNFVDVLQRYDLVQHVVDATRGDNTLDLLLTSSDDTSLLSEVAVQSTCFSDHLLVTSRMRVQRQTHTTSRYQYR